MQLSYRSLSLLIVLIVGVGIVSLFFLRKEEWGIVVIHNPDFQFLLPESFERNLEDRGQEKGQTELLFRATEGESLIATPLVVALRKETGLRIVTSLSHVALIPGLLRNIERAYPLRFFEYKEESEREFELEGKRSAELYFTYTAPAGLKIKQRLMVIAYDGDTALYFSAQSKESDFDQLNKKYFDRMFTSLRFK